MSEPTRSNLGPIHITYVDQQVDGEFKSLYSESFGKLKKKNIIKNDQWNYFGSVFIKSDKDDDPVFVVVLPRIFNPNAYPGNKRHYGEHNVGSETHSRFMLTEQTGLIVQMWKLIRYYKETESDRDSWKTQDDIVSFPNLDHADENPSIDAILSAFHLWYDYQEKSRLVFTERYFSPQGKGRIGWQKSIFRGEPIHTENGEVYRDLYRTVVRVDPYHEFVNLHMYICHWIGQHLFGEELDDSLDVDRPIPSNAFDLLDKYEGQLYQDRHVEVYQHLRIWCEFLSGNYTAGMPDPDSMNGVFVQFRFLWEWLLQQTLEQKPDNEIGVPELNGRYWLLNNQIHKGIEPRLDLIVDLKDEHKDEHSLLILDAKDYRAFLQNESKLPGSGDIYKQIVYRLAWKEWAKLNGRERYNAFLFPYDLFNYESTVVYYGAHVPINYDPKNQSTASGSPHESQPNNSSTDLQNDECDTDFEFTVHCFLVDFLSLVEFVLNESSKSRDTAKLDMMLKYMKAYKTHPVAGIVAQAHDLMKEY